MRKERLGVGAERLVEREADLLTGCVTRGTRQMGRADRVCPLTALSFPFATSLLALGTFQSRFFLFLYQYHHQEQMPI